MTKLDRATKCGMCGVAIPAGTSFLRGDDDICLACVDRPTVEQSEGLDVFEVLHKYGATVSMQPDDIGWLVFVEHDKYYISTSSRSPIYVLLRAARFLVDSTEAKAE